MKFSIVTPSFRNSRWLKLCIASVADQQGVTLGRWHAGLAAARPAREGFHRKGRRNV
jgi:hypothetical protein